MSVTEIESSRADLAFLPPRETLLAMHRTMVGIRQFEERVKTDYLARRMPGFTHSYVGEEAVATGGCAARSWSTTVIRGTRPPTLRRTWTDAADGGGPA